MTEKDLVEKLEERESLKEMEAYIKKQIDELEDAIKDAVTLNHPTACGVYNVNYSESIRESIDTKSMKVEYPVICDKFLKKTKFKTLRITKGKR